MKKFIVAIVGILTFGISGTSVVNSAPSAGTNSQGAPTDSRVSHMVSMINDIAVPMDVLIYAQTQYQGHAVTQAAKIIRDGNPVYRLRVDRDDIPTDYESFYLVYDMNWKLLGEEKTVPPPPKPAPAKREVKKPDRKPEKPETPEPQTRDDRKERDRDKDEDTDREDERQSRREDEGDEQ